MKNVLSMAAVCAFLTIPIGFAYALAPVAPPAVAPTSLSTAVGDSTAFAHVLADYLAVKDALVASDAALAASHATALAATLAAYPAQTGKAAAPVDALKKDAAALAAASGLAAQRVAFAKLGLPLWALAQGVKPAGKPLYHQYCPMKKAYWLSVEKEVKNPYYGNQMLNCGNVAATL